MTLTEFLDLIKVYRMLYGTAVAIDVFELYFPKIQKELLPNSEFAASLVSPRDTKKERT